MENDGLEINWMSDESYKEHRNENVMTREKGERECVCVLKLLQCQLKS